MTKTWDYCIIKYILLIDFNPLLLCYIGQKWGLTKNWKTT